APLPPRSGVIARRPSPTPTAANAVWEAEYQRASCRRALSPMWTMMTAYVSAVVRTRRSPRFTENDPFGHVSTPKPSVATTSPARFSGDGRFRTITHAATGVSGTESPVTNAAFEAVV